MRHHGHKEGLGRGGERCCRTALSDHRGKQTRDVRVTTADLPRVCSVPPLHILPAYVQDQSLCPICDELHPVSQIQVRIVAVQALRGSQLIAKYRLSRRVLHIYTFMLHIRSCSRHSCCNWRWVLAGALRSPLRGGGGPAAPACSRAPGAELWPAPVRARDARALALLRT